MMKDPKIIDSCKTTEHIGDNEPFEAIHDTDDTMDGDEDPAIHEKNRGAAASRRKCDFQHRRRDEKVLTLLTKAEEKRTVAEEHTGAKPIAGKIRNASKRCKHVRETSK